MPVKKQTAPHPATALTALHDRLAEVIGRWTSGSEDRATPITNLLFFRREARTELLPMPRQSGTQTCTPSAAIAAANPRYTRAGVPSAGRNTSAGAPGSAERNKPASKRWPSSAVIERISVAFMAERAVQRCDKRCWGGSAGTVVDRAARPRSPPGP